MPGRDGLLLKECLHTGKARLQPMSGHVAEDRVAVTGECVHLLDGAHGDQLRRLGGQMARAWSRTENQGKTQLDTEVEPPSNLIEALLDYEFEPLRAMNDLCARLATGTINIIAAALLER